MIRSLEIISLTPYRGYRFSPDTSSTDYLQASGLFKEAIELKDDVGVL